jgi:hypothetical protein
MTTTEIRTPSFRKTRGAWVVFGAADLIHLGEVTVTKRDGTAKIVEVGDLGKPFEVDGITCRYGYLAPEPPRTRARREQPQTRREQPQTASPGKCGYCARHGDRMTRELDTCPVCGTDYDL